MTRCAWIFALLVAVPAAAQDSSDLFRIGNDVYLAGTSVALTTAGSTTSLLPGIGAATVASIALVPFLGWLVIPILALTELGALAIGVFRPELRPGTRRLFWTL